MQFYNSLTRQKETYHPLYKDKIGLYVCGPTVYSYAHIGNARPVVIFDLLYRLLKQIYGKTHQITYVRNITDIDDKIIKASQETGITISKITEKYARIYNEDANALGCLPPDIQPKATEHLEPMIEMIKTLIKKGHAYKADAHILFDTSSMPSYGSLSKTNAKDRIAGARIEIASYKKNPEDFVLWKPSKQDEPGWDSPFGFGRPGWHLECSAMSETYLGEEFDFHGGGQDLLFPHHENERAQSCCAHGTKEMARFWLHNGYLTLEGDKMSKSQGNIITIHSLLKNWPGEVIRLCLLSAHYRQPLHFSKTSLFQAKQNLDKFYGALKSFKGEPLKNKEVIEALSDDLNTPKALAILHALANEIHKTKDKAPLQAQLLAGGQLLGLFSKTAQEWFQGEKNNENHSSKIEALIKERSEAKKNKDFERADQIRQELKMQGILLEDSPQGTSWRRI